MGGARGVDFRVQARTPQLRPLCVLPGHWRRLGPLGVTRAHPGHTDDLGPGESLHSEPGGLGTVGSRPPLARWDSCSKTETWRLGHSGRRPALSLTRSRACCLAPISGVHTPARGGTAQPRVPEEAARQPLTSRLGARSCQYSLRRRKRGGAPLGGGVRRSRPLTSQREGR